jgi:hypothetical protein
VIGATKWTRITKLRAKGPTPREKQNVRGLVLEAKRAQAQVVAFIRDADDDTERERQISAAIERSQADFKASTSSAA